METQFKKETALIGAGEWGKNISKNLVALNVLHTICDINPALLNHYQTLYPHVLLTENYQTVMENPEIKSVFIAAPVFQHYHLTKEAILAGKDVYVEKPFCLDCRDAKELIDLAKSRKVILMVGHLLHYHPCVRKMKQLIHAGVLGKLQYIASHRLNLGRIRTEENALWNFAPHDVSLILSLCGDRLPQKIRCVGEAFMSPTVADIAMITLKFSHAVRAHIYVSWLNPFKEQKLIVLGSDALLVFDDTKPWKEKLSVVQNHVKWNNSIPEIAHAKSEYIAVDYAEPLREECLHFLHCCWERQEPLTNGTEALRVLKVLQAAEESLNQDGKAMRPHMNVHASHVIPTRRSLEPAAVAI